MITTHTKIAFDRGYRAIEGQIISPTGKTRKLHFRGGACGYKYPCFNVKINGKVKKIKCHLLVAWEKFGDACKGKEVEVRHLDGNEFNFSHDNIEIGSKEENTNDRERHRRGKLTNQHKGEPGK